MKKKKCLVDEDLELSKVSYLSLYLRYIHNAGTVTLVGAFSTLLVIQIRIGRSTCRSLDDTNRGIVCCDIAFHCLLLPE